MSRNICFAIVLSILLASNVLALGVTPGRTTFSFEPGAEKNFSFSIVNSIGKDSEIFITLEGEFNKSILLSETSIFMDANESEKRIDVILKMPYELSPGAHSTSIIITQPNTGFSEKNTYLGASLSVKAELLVIVPYPGKYLIAGANVVGPDNDGNLFFIFPVVNRGTEDVERAVAVVDILDSNGNKISTINSEADDVPASQRTELVGKYSEILSPGNYLLSAVIYYDEQSLKIERLFSIGQPTIELKKIEVSNFALGGIAKFTMTVENRWNEDMKRAYSKMRIYNSAGELVSEFKSSEQDILAEGNAVLIAYWDSAGTEKAVYDAVLSLNYGNSSNEKRFKLDVGENKIDIIGVSYVISGGDVVSTDINITALLTMAVVALTVINLLWFLLIRKRLSKRK